VCCGVGVVELLMAAGWKPLVPLGWPGLALILAAAFRGVSAAVGGSVVIVAYLLFALGQPQRFPHFFAGAETLAFWVIGLSAATAAAALLRERLAQAQVLARKAAQSEAALKALSEYRQWVDGIIDNAPALIGYVDAEQRFKFSNLTCEYWLEKPKGEITGRSVREVYGETEYLKLKPHLERALRGGRVTFLHEQATPGGVRHAQTSYVPDFDPRGRVRGCFVLAKDIGSALEAQQRYELALSGSSVTLWDVNLQTGEVRLGDSLTSIDALPALIHPDDRAAVRRSLRALLKGESSVYVVEQRMRMPSGEWKWILARGRVTQRDPQSGRALRMFGTNVDIHERKLAEQTIERGLRIDAQSGVASAGVLIDRLQRALARAQRTAAPLALMHLALDRFAPLAERLGRRAAEALLAEVAARLRGCIRVSDTVARVGDEQFVVLLEVLKEPNDAFRVAEKTLRALRAPIPAADGEVRLTASIGVAFPDGADVAAEELVRRASSALAAARSVGDAYRSSAPSPR
jgi:diguanylate cyclase (GGDEF)-like protein